jgi:hypothetical protein
VALQIAAKQLERRGRLNPIEAVNLRIQEIKEERKILEQDEIVSEATQ